ncbi:TIGR00725 family protein [Haloarchaeobius amylolyticus]|uniref:TIGR00725 family protein n=1 Tax=Haloarchaeobius amylolyticus TaxID=1198296 RepID=UPI002270DB63|nr:TIGR00725 family protein [Haloarchaeobius amylolyticus]
MRVSVIGGSSVSDESYDLAEEVGYRLGKRGHTVICGGLTGVMRAVSEGANNGGGTTIGILPGENYDGANAYVDIPIATGMGHARNSLVAMNGDAVIAIDGEWGTLSEIALSKVYDRPVVGLNTHDVPGLDEVETPEEAVEYVETNR